MTRVMTMLLAVATVTVAACGPRKVEVGTAPATATTDQALSIHMSNNLSQPVNVYVVNGATEIFVKQVAAGSTEDLPVRGVTSAASVTLRATTADGTKTYTKNDVTLSASYNWQVP